MQADDPLETDPQKIILRFIAASMHAVKFLGDGQVRANITPHLNKQRLLRLLKKPTIALGSYGRVEGFAARTRRIDNPYRGSTDPNDVRDVLTKAFWRLAPRELSTRQPHITLQSTALK